MVIESEKARHLATAIQYSLTCSSKPISELSSTYLTTASVTVTEMIPYFLEKKRDLPSHTPRLYKNINLTCFTTLYDFLGYV